MKIDTYRYRRIHDRSPKGYGLWAFSDASETRQTFIAGLYSDAKKQAEKWAEKQGLSCIYVLG